MNKELVARRQFLATSAGVVAAGAIAGGTARAQAPGKPANWRSSAASRFARTRAGPAGRTLTTTSSSRSSRPPRAASGAEFNPPTAPFPHGKGVRQTRRRKGLRRDRFRNSGLAHRGRSASASVPATKSLRPPTPIPARSRRSSPRGPFGAGGSRSGVVPDRSGRRRETDHQVHESDHAGPHDGPTGQYGTGSWPIAKKHGLKVIEDACQGHLSNTRGKRLGTDRRLRLLQLPDQQDDLLRRRGARSSATTKNCSTSATRSTTTGRPAAGGPRWPGPKYRMNELEGAILMGQLPTVHERFQRRNENAFYLREQLKGFKGLVPQKLYEGTKTGAWYLFPMSYYKEQFAGVDRAKFLKALSAEGVTLSPYIGRGLHREPWIENVLKNPRLQRAVPQGTPASLSREHGLPQLRPSLRRKWPCSGPPDRCWRRRRI